MLRYYLYLNFTLFLYTFRFTTGDEQCNKNKELPMHLQIKEHILCDYDKTVRPVIHNNATPLDIKFLVHHFDFEAPDLFEVEAWFGMKWVDEHIHWDPEKFNNIKTIVLTTDDIWTPDLAIYNRGSYGLTKIIQNNAECLISYYEKVVCISQTRIRGMCRQDFRYYPFDVQNCTLKIGSWFHSGEEIDLKETEVLTDIVHYYQFFQNPEWTLESLTFEKDPGKDEKYPDESYPSLKFNFVIRRNASAKFAIFVLPILVLVGMSILTLWLDPFSSDRIFMLVVNIPAHVVAILNVEWELSNTGDTVPYIIYLMENSQLIVSFTLVETIVIRYLLNKTKESPGYLINIFSVFANYKIGQLLLFSELNPENAAENLTADDSSNLVEVTERPKEWYLLGKVIDRLSFVVTIFVYVVMCILCVPKK